MYDVAIFGATFACAGFLSAYKGRGIVIERNTLCGYEFINALKKGTCFEEKATTEEGVAFYKKLQKRGVFERDFNLFDSSVPLYECFENKNVCLATQICDVQRCEEGFEIKVFNSGGFDVVKAKQIIDTTCHDEMVISKTLNAIVKSADFLEESGIDERKILKCRVDVKDDFFAARAKLKAELEKGMIADYIAPVFDFVTGENILRKEEITYITSVSFKNPLLAFDAGCRLAKEEF